MGESPGYLLLSGTVVGENLDHVCWVGDFCGVDKQSPPIGI